MIFKQLTPEYFVSGQLSTADVSAAAEQGIKTIICNRPDNESPDQPQMQDIALAANKVGITFLQMPVSGFPTDEKAGEFEAAYSEAERPMLAYCASGTRSVALWALTSAKTLGADAVLSAARNAGYDLSALRPRLQQLSAI